MSRKMKPVRWGAMAGLAVAVSLWLPEAAALGQVAAPRVARLPSAGPGPAISNVRSAPWLGTAIGGPVPPAGPLAVTTGNFSSCPKLPAGYSKAKFTCFIIHVTGGRLQMGQANQAINRPMTISYAEGTDPQGSTTIVFGSMKSRPMPVSGGIFLNPQLNWYTENRPDLQLSVKPMGLGAQPDTTGAGVADISMDIRAINPVFGSKCLIGSRQDPVTVDPTFGTTDPPPPNKPIHGHVKSTKQTKTETIIIGTVVDNAFAAQAAAGCGPALGLFTDGTLTNAVNKVVGLPSPAGTNTAIFKVTVELVPYTNVSS